MERARGLVGRSFRVPVASPPVGSWHAPCAFLARSAYVVSGASPGVLVSSLCARSLGTLPLGSWHARPLWTPIALPVASQHASLWASGGFPVGSWRRPEALSLAPRAISGLSPCSQVGPCGPQARSQWVLGTFPVGSRGAPCEPLARSLRSPGTTPVGWWGGGALPGAFPAACRPPISGQHAGLHRDRQPGLSPDGHAWLHRDSLARTISGRTTLRPGLSPDGHAWLHRDSPLGLSPGNTPGCTGIVPGHYLRFQRR